ncbi:Peptidase family C69 [Reticulomyxa filosa]|uniref:Peptidase family C69 n=1 Tax=Reticulomyxa filosa TaxID=46433 RepID=X6LLF9_RETFI|nr:Peptidase family C69 [Reticulomyxa filosa]|eukprot:ETO01565.1 Peptidase family C69 [Reticulomyxa filosa]
MGSNDCGVVIGNEAVFSNKKSTEVSSFFELPLLYGNTSRTHQVLTGMDMVRLGLMFGDSALDAVKVITYLLSNYSQIGVKTNKKTMETQEHDVISDNVNCNKKKNKSQSTTDFSLQWQQQMTYYSSFMIVDSKECWIVESVDQWYVAKKYQAGIHVISNVYCLKAPFDIVSPDMTDYCEYNRLDLDSPDWDMQNHFGTYVEGYFQYIYYHLTVITVIIIMIIIDIYWSWGKHRRNVVKSKLEYLQKENAITACQIASYVLRGHECRSFMNPNKFETNRFESLDTSTFYYNQTDSSSKEEEQKSDPSQPYETVDPSKFTETYEKFMEERYGLSLGDYPCHRGWIGLDVCMHHNYGPIRTTATTGSLIVVIRPQTNQCFCSVKYPRVFPWKVLNIAMLAISRQHKKDPYFENSHKRETCASTTNQLYYESDKPTNKQQLWWKHEAMHRLWVKYCVDHPCITKWIQHENIQFEQRMFRDVLTQCFQDNPSQNNFNGPKSNHCDSSYPKKQSFTQQRKQSKEKVKINHTKEIMDKYWEESIALLDKCLQRVQQHVADQVSGTNRIIACDIAETETSCCVQKTDKQWKLLKLFVSLITHVIGLFGLINYLDKTLSHYNWFIRNEKAKMYINSKGEFMQASSPNCFEKIVLKFWEHLSFIFLCCCSCSCHCYCVVSMVFTVCIVATILYCVFK